LSTLNFLLSSFDDFDDLIAVMLHDLISLATSLYGKRGWV